jgi:heparanase
MKTFSAIGCMSAGLIAALYGLGIPFSAMAQADMKTVALSPSSMPALGTISERYQSYNVEMLEVTGGKFWKPYASKTPKTDKRRGNVADNLSEGTPAGMNADAYSYRPPIDLSDKRRRILAAALGPSYVRVSGTWANTTYFPDSDEVPKATPTGFDGVLTHQMWKHVVDFSNAVDAPIITSFTTSPGTRDQTGVWTAAQARVFVAYNEKVGGQIAAAEFMNEPTMAAMGGAPKGYDATAYGHDFKVFCLFMKEALPKALILGPGSVGETTGDWGVGYGLSRTLKTEDLLSAAGLGIDAFSYHHYGASSQRCSASGMPGTTADAALSEEWLARTDQTLVFYKKLRDQFEPGKPLWVTETADAACGGNPWASTFLDTFRYLDQLGRLARQGVEVVAHNTLDASDYGLLDENTLTPRPNYWGALLWRKLMGTVVLDSGVPIQKGLHVYAHSLRNNSSGGIALLIINNDQTNATTIQLPVASVRYTLSAHDLRSKIVFLNGRPISLGSSDTLPVLTGIATPPGVLQFPPATITFLAISGANNMATGGRVNASRPPS